MAELIDLNKPKVFAREGELYSRLVEVIDDYAGEISLVSAVGVLELVKDYVKGD